MENRDVAETLLGEAHRRDADLIVLGGYGHSRVREWLLGGVTYKLMHQSPFRCLCRTNNPRAGRRSALPIPPRE